MASLAEGLSLRFYVMVLGLHLRNSYKWIVATMLKSSNIEHAPPLQNILLHTELPMRFLRAGTESYLLCTLCLVQGLSLNGYHINVGSGTSLLAQWLRHRASNAGGSGSIPGWGTENPHAVKRGGEEKKLAELIFGQACVSTNLKGIQFSREIHRNLLLRHTKVC